MNLGTTTTGQYDADSFTYYPNTGRLHTYQFSVNSQTDTGTLAWNANGSLSSLAINDQIPGTTDSQTCNYTHDDLGRIATANCGTVQNQTLSYDPFGNITKTANAGVGNFTVGYNQANNRIAATGYTYDNNGNLLTDATGSHQYSWDAEGRPTSVDGVTLTYDAMGRMVEQARNSDTNCITTTDCTQIVYGPGGDKLALMNAQTLNKAFVPLPVGATAVYNSSGLQYYRHSDWLGSSRLASTPARMPYSTTAYAPFGEPYDETGTVDRSFTGENQDTISGLYDFMFREQSPGQGRWISPDPAGMGAVSLTDPQSWNRYAYVSNSPLTSIDPLGLVCTGSGPGRCVVDPIANEFGWSPLQILLTAWTPTRILVFRTGDRYGIPYFDYSNFSMLSLLNTTGGGGGGGGGGVRLTDLANLDKLITVINQCAAQNAVSIGDLFNVNKDTLAGKLLGNDASTFSNLVFGPGRADAIKDIGTNGPQDSEHAPLSVTSGAWTVVKQVPLKWFGSNSSFAVTEAVGSNGVTITRQVGTTIGDVALVRGVGSALSGLAAAKAIFDVSSYLRSLTMCALNP